MDNPNVTIGELAGMVKAGFDQMTIEFRGVKKDIQDLKTGQEEIKLRLDNVAYRFELIELQRRVQLLEQRAGIKHD